MTTTSSAVSAISLIRWLETKTVRPSRARPFKRLRTQRIPSGSSPFTGSSNSSTSGSPSSAAAMPSRWPMPSENFPARWRATDASPTRSSTSSTRPRRDVVGLGEHPQVVAGAAPGMDRLGLEEGADLVERPREIVVMAAVHRDVAGVRDVEAHDHAHRRRLARAVRTEESGHDARADVEAQLVDGELARRSAWSGPWPRSPLLLFAARKAFDRCDHHRRSTRSCHRPGGLFSCTAQGVGHARRYPLRPPRAYPTSRPAAR